MLESSYLGTVSGIQLHPGGSFDFKLTNIDTADWKQYFVDQQGGQKQYFTWILVAFLRQAPMQVLVDIDSPNPENVQELIFGNM